MSKFDNLIGRKPPEEDPLKGLTKIGGSYQCQTCNECVYSALYNREKSELGWKCSNGHISVIGGFEI